MRAIIAMLRPSQAPLRCPRVFAIFALQNQFELSFHAGDGANFVGHRSIPPDRLYTYTSAREAMEFVETAPKLDFEHGLPLALASSFGIEASAQAVDLVHACAGTSAILDERPFQKYFRDFHTRQQHAFSWQSRFESVGKILLGRASDWAFYYL
jgi:hypothetical protein